MKRLVVYYTRTGNTRKAAEAIATACGGDLEEIREVGVDRDRRVGPASVQRVGQRRCFFSGFAIVNDDIVARRVQVFRDRRADPARRAGEQGDGNGRDGGRRTVGWHGIGDSAGIRGGTGQFKSSRLCAHVCASPAR